MSEEIKKSKILSIDSIKTLKSYIDAADTYTATNIDNALKAHIESKIYEAQQHISKTYDDKYDELSKKIADAEQSGASSEELNELQLELQALQGNYNDQQAALVALNDDLQNVNDNYNALNYGITTGKIFNNGQLNEIINTALIEGTVITDDMVSTPSVFTTKIAALIGNFGQIKAENIIGGAIKGHTIESNNTITETGEPVWKIGNSGEGWLACKNISWDENGDVTFGDNVKLGWGNISDVPTDFGSGISVFTSTVFTRTNETPETPTGGSFDSPLPEGEIWHDSIPTGNEILWASTRVFASDGGEKQQEKWSTPAQMTDTSDFEVIYSSVENPAFPTAVNFSKDEDGNISQEWLNSNTDWKDNPDDGTIWMATINYNNGVWDGWKLSKIKGEKGEKGDPGNGSSSKIVMLYASGNTVEKPSNDCIWDWNNNTLKNQPEEWKTTDNELSSPIWMTTRIFSSAEELNDAGWSAPVKITGADGEKGKDGDSIEFIYYLTDSDNTPNIPDSEVTPEQIGPNVWTDHPTGVSTDYQFEYFSMRQKSGDELWGDWSEPTLWAKYGANGQDGDGVQYIYILTEDDKQPDNPTPQQWENDESYQSNSEWLPEDDSLKYKWTDDPTGIDKDHRYEWVSSRKYYFNQEHGRKMWHEFSNPSLWSKFALDGEKGTSTIIAGSFDDLKQLRQRYPDGPDNDGDSYIVGNNLYVWLDNEWKDAGQIKGEDGVSAYIHIKYAKSIEYDDNGNIRQVEFTENNGEAVGPYQGIYTDTVEDDSDNWQMYKWSKIDAEEAVTTQLGKYQITSGLIKGKTFESTTEGTIATGATVEYFDEEGKLIKIQESNGNIKGPSWQLHNEGTGYFANGNIQWNSDGEASFCGGTVQVLDDKIVVDIPKKSGNIIISDELGVCAEVILGDENPNIPTSPGDGYNNKQWTYTFGGGCDGYPASIIQKSGNATCINPNSSIGLMINSSPLATPIYFSDEASGMIGNLKPYTLDLYTLQALTDEMTYNGRLDTKYYWSNTTIANYNDKSYFYDTHIYKICLGLKADNTFDDETTITINLNHMPFINTLICNIDKNTIINLPSANTSQGKTITIINAINHANTGNERGYSITINGVNNKTTIHNCKNYTKGTSIKIDSSIQQCNLTYSGMRDMQGLNYWYATMF